MKRIKKLEKKIRHNCPTCQATYTLLETHLAKKEKYLACFVIAIISNGLKLSNQKNMINNLTKYTNWLKRKNFAFSTIQTYRKIASKYHQQKLTTTNIKNIFQQNLTKYEAGYLILEKTVLASYTKFQNIRIQWEKITQIIPRVQKKFFASKEY